MRIGLLTDIHESVEKLRIALKRLQEEEPDVIIQLGDACDLFGPARDRAITVELLRNAGVIGVWGNHDIGFCHEVDVEVQRNMAPEVLAYMSEMRPWRELDDCHFSHGDPFIDPTDALAIWSAGEKPETLELAERSFAAVPHRCLFIGHYHGWLAVSDRGRVDWDGSVPIKLDPDRRFLVVVGPVFNGSFGLFDTETAILTPYIC